MSITDEIREIKARAEQILDGPEVQGMGQFYSAATLDVQTLLAIAEQLIVEGGDAEAQAQIVELLATVDALTGELAAKVTELAELQTQYDRLRVYLNGIPPAAAGGIPLGQR
jgi:hypothetical protein